MKHNMIIKERHLRKVIRQLLISEQAALAVRAVPMSAQGAFLALKVAEIGSPIPLSFSGARNRSAQAALPKIVKFIAGAQAGATAGSVVSFGILFAAVLGAFTGLPLMLKHSIEQLDTVEGFLKNFRENLGRPINPEDISDTRDLSFPKFGQVAWNPDLIIDFLAAGMTMAEGRSLIGMLTASEYKWEGLRKRGPVISQKFMNSVQKRRRGLAEEAREKTHKEIIRVAEEKMKTPAGQKEVVELVDALGLETVDKEETA